MEKLIDKFVGLAISTVAGMREIAYPSYRRQPLVQKEDGSLDTVLFPRYDGDCKLTVDWWGLFDNPTPTPGEDVEWIILPDVHTVSPPNHEEGCNE